MSGPNHDSWHVFQVTGPKDITNPFRPSSPAFNDEAWRSMTKHDEAWRSMTKHDELVIQMSFFYQALSGSFCCSHFSICFLSIVNNNSVYVAVCFGICFTMPYHSSLWAISIWKVDDLPVPASSPNVTICHNVTMVWQNLKMFNCLKPKGLPRHFPWPLKHFPYSCGQNRCSLPQKAPLPTAGQLIVSASTGVYRVIKDSTS